MSYNFSFDGRSRQSRLNLASDRTRGIAETLSETRAARHKRQEEQRRQAAATAIQRRYRGFVARRRVGMRFSQEICALIEQFQTANNLESAFRCAVQIGHRLLLVPKCTLGKAVVSFKGLSDQISRDLFASSHNGNQLAECVRCDQTLATKEARSDTTTSALVRLVSSVCAHSRDVLVAGNESQVLDALDSVLALVQFDASVAARCQTGVILLLTTSTPPLHWRDADSAAHKPCQLLMRSIFPGLESSANDATGSQDDTRSHISDEALLSLVNSVSSTANNNTNETTDIASHVVGTKSASLSRKLEKQLLSIAARATTTAPNTFRDPLHVLQHLIRQAVVDDAQGAEHHITPTVDVSERIAGINGLLRAVGYAFFLRHVLTELRQQQAKKEAACPSVLLYTQLIPRFLSQAAEDGRDLSTLDQLCALVISPILAFAQKKENEREIVPVLSRLAFARQKTSVIKLLWEIIRTRRQEWVGKDARGATLIRYPNIPVLFCQLYAYVVTSCDISHTYDDMLSKGDIKVVVLTFRDLVFYMHMHGCASDEGSIAFAHASYMLLAKVHTVDEQARLLETTDWVVSSYPYPSSISSEQWSSAFEDPTQAVARSGNKRTTILDHFSSSDDDDDDDEENEPGKQPKKQQQQQQTATMKRRRLEFDPNLPQITRVVQLLSHCPFIVPFPVRVSVFGTLMMDERDRVWRFVSESDEVKVRRTHAFGDAFEIMSKFSADQLVNRTRVRFVGADGNVEAGFGDGVFREFVLSVCQTGFSPDAGLFAQTQERKLYPRPYTNLVVGPDHLKRFEFLGRMVGKALREGVLLDVPFASCFRNLLLGRTNGINDLEAYDPELYRHLSWLRTLSADDIDAMCLSFCVTVDILGKVHEVALIPNGADTVVTKDNVVAYIHLMADFKLNRETKKQAQAFRDGLADIVPLEWIQLFDSNEFQVVFQGTEDSVGFDVDDWRAHTSYSGGYEPDHPTITLFWDAVSQMTPEEQRLLLKFSTGVDRAPLLGFRHMVPTFHVARGGAEADRLPSAATCMCMLKLPEYKDFATMRSKLLTAIKNTTTFEMS